MPGVTWALRDTWGHSPSSLLWGLFSADCSLLTHPFSFPSRLAAALPSLLVPGWLRRDLQRSLCPRTPPTLPSNFPYFTWRKSCFPTCPKQHLPLPDPAFLAPYNVFCNRLIFFLPALPISSKSLQGLGAASPWLAADRRKRTMGDHPVVEARWSGDPRIFGLTLDGWSCLQLSWGRW